MRSRLIGSTLALVACWFGAAEAADPDRLAPHRALYEMTLARTHSGSGVVAVRGKMAIEWLRACDGWTFEHKSEMAIDFASGEDVRLSTYATSWESFDGTSYRFSMRNLTGEGESERIEGTASLERPGGAGKAEFSQPKTQSFDLPPGTLFPVAHTAELLRRAQRDQPPVLFSAVVFDGMGEDGPLTATATVGKMSRAEIGPESPAAKLSGEAAWPVHVAYFPVDSPSPLPKQEVGMRIYANGIADDLRIGFDDFVVQATLAKLEFLKPSECAR